MAKWLCRIGIHRWIVGISKFRICKRCHRKQRLLYYGRYDQHWVNL